MNIQEIEELEFGDGHKNELSRLFEQTRGEIKVEKVSKDYISWLTSLGFFVMVSYYDVYCPFTDAYIGRGEVLEVVSRSYAEVEHNKDWFDFHGEECTVYPPERGEN